MDIQEYQSKYDSFNEALKAIKADMKQLVTSAEKDGFYIVDNK